MAKRFLTNLDLNKNQLLNAVLQQLTVAPSSPVEGQVYYNTIDHKIYYYDGTTWVDITGDITDVVAGDGLSGGGSTGSVTLYIGANQVSLSMLQNINNNSVLGNVSGSYGNVSMIDIVSVLDNSSTTIPNTAAVKSYIDNAITALGKQIGGWDPTSGTLPSASPYSTKKGDYWYVTANGTITIMGTDYDFSIGDVIIANVDNASTSDILDWVVLEGNRDQATETNLGMAKIAADYDLTNGTDDTKIVTPYKLKVYLDNRTGGYTTYIGDGVNTSYTVMHGLNTSDVIVAVYDASTFEEVIVDVKALASSFIMVDFATAPSFNAYKVVIKK
jgi:hypothetical protein